MADPQDARKGMKLTLILTVLVFIILAIALVRSCQESNTDEDVINPPDPLPRSNSSVLGLHAPAEAEPLRAA